VIEIAGCGTALPAFIARESRARQPEAARFRVLGRLACLMLHVDRRVHGPVFVPALPWRPVGKVAAPGVAGRQMQGSEAVVAG